MFHSQERAPGAKLLLTIALAGAVALSACGSDNKKDVAKFIGAWSIDSGALTASCPPLALPMQPITPGEKLVFSPGTDSDLVIERSGCKIKFDVNGDVATAQSGQSCAATIPNPVPGSNGAPVAITLGVTKGVFTAKGTMGTFEQSGNATLPIPVLSGCTYGINALATKMP